MPRNYTCSHVLSESQLRDFSARLSRIVQPPCVISLQGELGAGKTTFVRGFVQGLQQSHFNQRISQPRSSGPPQSTTSNVHVTSPTYCLGQTYKTQPLVHHLDLYRLTNEGDLWDLGLAELILDEQALVFVEWPKGFVESIGPKRHIQIFLKHQQGDEGKRLLEVSCCGNCPKIWEKGLVI